MPEFEGFHVFLTPLLYYIRYRFQVATKHAEVQSLAMHFLSRNEQSHGSIGTKIAQFVSE